MNEKVRFNTLTFDRTFETFIEPSRHLIEHLIKPSIELSITGIVALQGLLHGGHNAAHDWKALAKTFLIIAVILVIAMMLYASLPNTKMSGRSPTDGSKRLPPYVCTN